MSANFKGRMYMDNGWLYTDEGFLYPNGKIAGKKSSFGFANNALYVFGAGFGKNIGQAFGAVGAVVGASVDAAVSKKSHEKGPTMTVAYADITEVAIHKSLLNGKGIMFTLKDGSKFKIATPQLSYKFKDTYPKIAEIVKVANPAAVVQSL